MKKRAKRMSVGTLRQLTRMADALSDAQLLLAACRDGVADFVPRTAEFRFHGLLYSCRDGDWSKLCDVIGRDKLIKSVSAATSDRIVHVVVT